MNWQDFYDEIKTGIFRQAYLLYGQEDYTKRDALQKVRAALLVPGLEALNEAVLEGVDAARIIEAAETLPVMCDKRLVVVRDWQPFTGEKKDITSDGNRVLSWLDTPCSSCVLIFYMRGDVSKKNGLVAEMTKRGLGVEFGQLSDADIRKWLAAHLKPLGKRMSPSAMQLLIFTAGRELTRLEGEISKLAAYSGDRADIDEADVEAVVSPSLEFGAFDMLNHLFDGDASGAYKTLDMMLERGANRVQILSSIIRQLRGMTYMRMATASGLSAEATGKSLALNDYAAKIMERKSRKYGAEALERIYKEAIEADFSIKSGRARDSAALDMLLIKISSLTDKNAQQFGGQRRQNTDGK